MYAVIKTGGKQYKVASGDVIKVEKLAGDEGSEIVFSEVLALGDNVGKPLVAGASVKATILKQAKADKVIVFKKKRQRGSLYTGMTVSSCNCQGAGAPKVHFNI